MKLKLENKYTFEFSDNGALRILRFDQEWRNETGDKALLSLLNHAVELENKIKEAVERLEILKVAVNDNGPDPMATHFVEETIKKLGQ